MGDHVHQDDLSIVEEELKHLKVNRAQSNDYAIVLPKTVKNVREEKSDEEKQDSSDSDDFLMDATPKTTQSSIKREPTTTTSRGRGRGRGRAKTVKTTPTRAKRNPF